MAGKITFRNGLHPSVVGGLVASVEIAPKYRAAIEEFLNRNRRSKDSGSIDRKLTDAELAMLCGGLGMVRSFQEMNDDRANSQDIKETLAAIAKMVDPDKAARAYTECDAMTQGVLTGGLHKLGVRDFSAPDPELIRQAAAARLATFPDGVNGRPKESWRGYFAGFARQSWASLGCTDDKAWQQENCTASDFAQFALYLLNAGCVDRQVAYTMDAVLKILNPRNPRKPRKK